MKENEWEQEEGSALDLALIKIKAQIIEVASNLQYTSVEIGKNSKCTDTR
jgi:hypothetical protein